MFNLQTMVAAAATLALLAGPAGAQSQNPANPGNADDGAGYVQGGEDKVDLKGKAPKSSEDNVEVTIKDFAGRYVGRGVTRSQGARYFGLANRDLDVVIKTTDNGGYTLTWTTVRRRVSPTSEKRKASQTIEFVATKNKNVWKAKNSGALLEGKPVMWSRLSGSRLTVYVMQVNPRSGRYASAVYVRELIEGGMQLRFRRVTDGAPVRTVVAFLEKQPEDAAKNDKSDGAKKKDAMKKGDKK